MNSEMMECVARAAEIVPAGIVVAQLDDALTIECSNDGYYELVGYTREECLEQFRGAFFPTILSDYIEEANSVIRELLPSDGKFSVKIKLLHKWRGYIWAHISGRIFEGEGGVPLVCFVVVDISEHLFLMEQIEKEHEYINMLLLVSGDSFFDYDVQRKTMRFSSNFSSRFGIDETMFDYPASLLATGIVGNDSRGVIEKGEFDPNVGVISDIHLKLPDGGDAWYSLYFNVAKDSEDNPSRVVGKMIDVTERIEDIAQLTDKAARDPLTKLLNKEETRLRIEKSLCDKRINGFSAFIIIDIDAFKTVNDTFGHQVGDVVLTEVAKRLGKIFRDSDIVGRLGGDEFTVLLRGARTKELIEKKGNDVVEAMRKITVGKKGEYSITGSVGISIFPSHGDTFEELYRLADEALYESKRKGKNCFTIYDGKKK